MEQAFELSFGNPIAGFSALSHGFIWYQGLICDHSAVSRNNLLPLIAVLIYFCAATFFLLFWVSSHIV